MKVLIGFEVHQQLMTNQKLFCECPTNYQDVAPNTNVCPICTGMPGSKPLPPNEQAINSAIEIALMLDCKVIAGQPIFIQRKHYDYPDLPNGYQRTSLPIAKDGLLEEVHIREIHLEEDPGQYDPTSGVVDFNRCGVPLVEIVTEPDMHSPEEARKFLRRLVRVLEYSGKVRPEAGGAMRVDTNISLEGGGRVEVKNINSIKGAYRAIKFELIRQKSKLERGEQVIRETRAFLESQKITVSMRVKELEEDYRYIPDPDIYPIIIDQSRIESIRKKMVEAPHIREKRLMEQYGIEMESASVIASERELADLFEAIAFEVDPKFAATWFRTKLKKVLNYMKIRAAEIKFTKRQLADLLKMVVDNEITPEQGEIVLRMMAKKPEDPRKLIEKLKIAPLSEREIENAIDKALDENKKAVEDYLKGKEEALNFLAGNVIKITGGKADPREIIKKLRKKLDLIQREGNLV